MEQPIIAVYDANILYPAPLRDLFIRIAHAGLVRGRWTDIIHDEWIRNVSKDNPHLSLDRLLRTKSLMNAAVRDCLITEYETLIDSLVLPDPDDRHVLAAAIKAEASVIVTFNLMDFPNELLKPHSIEAIHPDVFLRELVDQHPEIIWGIVKGQRQSLQNPPKSVDEFLATLANQGLANFVGCLQTVVDQL